MIDRRFVSAYFREVEHEQQAKVSDMLNQALVLWQKNHPRTVTCAPLDERVGDVYRAYRREADEAYFNRSR